MPLGTLICVTGVSGSGKSTLVDDVLYKAVANRLHRARQRPGAHRDVDGLEALDKIIAVDQSPIGRTPRSNPATYTGLFDEIRDVFAKTAEARARGYKPGRFSFNVKGGRCEACRGDGQIRIEMHFLPDVYVPCEQCHGRRYNRETLEVRFKGKTIADVLDMTVRRRSRSSSTSRRSAGAWRRCTTWASAICGSASRRRRSPAARRSGSSWPPSFRRSRPGARSTSSTSRRPACISPTSSGCSRFSRLVDAGNTVVVIEHNLDVIKCADWLIDLGPEGGDEGGRVVASGTPEDVAAVAGSHTGRFLAPLLGAAPTVRRRRRRAVGAPA